MPTGSSRLGELLEKRGIVPRELLLRALRNQKVVGGRLGTCLLEIEALSEEELCSALAEQQGVPFATPEDLRSIPDEVLALLPAKVAKRCQAIAFEGSATQVKVALIDARNLALQDEISFVVGKRIRWYVAPEMRMLEALEKHHGEECPTRISKLLDRMNRSRFLWAREKSTTTASAMHKTGDQLQWDTRIAGVADAETRPFGRNDSPSSVSLELPQFQHQSLDLPTVSPAPGPTPARAAALPLPPAPAAPASDAPAQSPSSPAPSPKRAPPAEPSLPASSAATSAKAPAASPAARSTPAPKPAARKQSDERGPEASPTATPRRHTVEEAEKRLLQPSERDDVARVLLDFASGLRPRAVLFVIRKEEVAAWMWSGAGIDDSRLSALRLRLSQPSLFAGLKEEGAYFRGPLAPLPAHLALSACFASPPIAGDVLVLPVKVRERLVAALLLEPGASAGSELGPGDLADLHRVIAKAEIGFELCIMQSKLRKA